MYINVHTYLYIHLNYEKWEKNYTIDVNKHNQIFESLIIGLETL